MAFALQFNQGFTKVVYLCQIANLLPCPTTEFIDPLQGVWHAWPAMFLEVKWLVRLLVTTTFWIGQYSLRSLPWLLLCTLWLHSVNKDAYYTAENYCSIIRKLTSNQQINYSNCLSLFSLQMHPFSMTKILLRLHHSVTMTMHAASLQKTQTAVHQAHTWFPKPRIHQRAPGGRNVVKPWYHNGTSGDTCHYIIVQFAHIQLFSRIRSMW